MQRLICFVTTSAPHKLVTHATAIIIVTTRLITTGIGTTIIALLQLQLLVMLLVTRLATSASSDASAVLCNSMVGEGGVSGVR